MPHVNEICLGCGNNTKNDRHRRLLQSEQSRHVITLWSYIFNLEVQNTERETSDRRAQSLVDAGGRMCRKCFTAYDKCTQMIVTLRKSIGNIADVIGNESESDNSDDGASLRPPAPKRVAFCCGPSTASPDVTVKTERNIYTYNVAMY